MTKAVAKKASAATANIDSVLPRLAERRISELVRSLEKRSGKKYGVLVHGNRDCGGQDYDYVEQLIPPLAGLLLKMADEQSRPPFNAPSPTGYGGTGKPSAVPKEVAWPSLLARARQLPFFKAFTRGPL